MIMRGRVQLPKYLYMIEMVHFSDPNVVWLLLVAKQGEYRNKFADPVYDASADPMDDETRSLEGWLGDDMDPWWLMVEKPLKCLE